MNKPLVTFEYNGEERKFLCHSEDGVYNVMTHDKQYYEMDLLNFVRSLNLEGVYIDVGAFIGTHTVFFLKECGGCTGVYAYECLPESFKLLEHNTKLNDCKYYVCYCISILDKMRSIRVIRATPDDLGRTKVKPVQDSDSVATSLDEGQGMYGKVALIKIDVEGNELLVLKGAVEIIKKWHPVLLTEVFRGSKMLGEIAAFLVPLGYKKINKFCHTPVYVWEWKDE